MVLFEIYTKYFSAKRHLIDYFKLRQIRYNLGQKWYKLGQNWYKLNIYAHFSSHFSQQLLMAEI
jgi:hypothetical protein